MQNPYVGGGADLLSMVRRKILIEDLIVQSMEWTTTINMSSTI